MALHIREGLMATKRQIAANRRNALKSTGPRSPRGKRRVAKNTLQHGLTAASPLGAEDAAVEDLARKLCDHMPDPVVLEHARQAARAQLLLQHMRVLKAEIINRIFACGALTFRPRFRSAASEAKYLRMQPRDQPLVWPPRDDLLAFLCQDEETRMGEAVRRTLKDLRKLARYEHRVFLQRGRACRAMRAAMTTARSAAEMGQHEIAKQTQVHE